MSGLYYRLHYYVMIFKQSPGEINLPGLWGKTRSLEMDYNFNENATLNTCVL